MTIKQQSSTTQSPQQVQHSTIGDTPVIISRPRTPKATLMLAHGAGAPMDSEFMTRYSLTLSRYDICVLRFEFDYMAQRRTGGSKRPPPNILVLVDQWRALIHRQQAQRGDPIPFFIGGKSMGGRVATLLNAGNKSASKDKPAWEGVICLGYPFHPQKQPLKLRTQHLSDPMQPTLIIQGTRDALGNQEEVISYALTSDIQLHWINTANHDLKPLARSQITHQNAIDDAAMTTNTFIEQCLQTQRTPKKDSKTI
ncbi:alpha/beta family hydrolase [Marinagarivorans algicola]|uniref:alpha/beta family hydrolase n=1 Tax=Marinagarivorans algicola TaxID=1513270 RepID=UPI000AACBD37|nr:alpha/beta family hydrolase [Marinagarivorans algicola]